MSVDGGVVIHIDPVEAERSKSRRDRVINVVLFPRYRAAGFALLIVAVVVHNLVILKEPHWDAVLRLTLAYTGYCALSWWAMIRWYDTLRGRLHLGTLFFALDLVAWTAAIYASGGNHSWLFFVLMLRSADQVSIGAPRVLGFAALGVACYTAMLMWMTWVDHASIDWAAEAVKMAFMMASSFYLLFPALNSQRLRLESAAAIRAARDAIGALNTHARQLEEARRRAEDATRVKGEFVGKISHELRTPMNIIMGMTELSLETELTVQQRGYLNLVRDCSQQFMGMITDLLDFSAMERNQLRLSDRPFRLREILDRVCTVCLEKARQKDLTVCFSAEPDVPDDLLGDAARLEQVLLCLGDNAVKFTERGRVDVGARVMESSDATVLLRFTVSDSGVGIPDHKQEVIFESFRGSDDSLTRRHGGSGLGLTISQGLVGLMGGSISVFSQMDEGTSFSFDVPFARAPAAVNGGD